MAEVESRLAVLEDWRRDHSGEHSVLWKKVDDNKDHHDKQAEKNAGEHIDFIRALERLDVKLTIFTTLGVGIGSIGGSIISALIIHLLTRGKG